MNFGVRRELSLRSVHTDSNPSGAFNYKIHSYLRSGECETSLPAAQGYRWVTLFRNNKYGSLFVAYSRSIGRERRALGTHVQSVRSFRYGAEIAFAVLVSIISQNNAAAIGYICGSVKQAQQHPGQEGQKCIPTLELEELE